MALAGLFLISFLIVHVGINSCIFYDLSFFDPKDNGEMFNKAAHFMGSTVVVRIIEIGLFALLILHTIQGWALEVQNRRRRGHAYQKPLGDRGSRWYSRSMAILGTLIFLFLVMHISHFWVPSRITHNLQEVPYNNGGMEASNLFLRMFEVFQNPIVVILYILGVAALLYHLMHGFSSAFRTMGVHNRKYIEMLRYFGYFFSILICVLFALMPVSMYLHWVSPQ